MKKSKKKKTQNKNRMEIAEQNPVKNAASIDGTETLLFTPTLTMREKKSYKMKRFKIGAKLKTKYYI